MDFWIFFVIVMLVMPLARLWLLDPELIAARQEETPPPTIWHCLFWITTILDVFYGITVVPVPVRLAACVVL
jgi:hypothetical protein